MAGGGRKIMFITVTHDESDTSFTAASIDLDYIEHIQQGLFYVASAIASNACSVALDYPHCSIDATHGIVTYSSAASTGSKQNLIVVGW